MMQKHHVVILEYSGGGAELAAPLPESAREVCLAAAECWEQGREKSARDIFLQLLSGSVSPRLRKKMRRWKVTELAHLAALLLDHDPAAETAPEDLHAAEQRLRNTGRCSKRTEKK